MSINHEIGPALEFDAAQFRGQRHHVDACARLADLGGLSGVPQRATPLGLTPAALKIDVTVEGTVGLVAPYSGSGMGAGPRHCRACGPT